MVEYLEAKEKAKIKTVVYQTKCKPERKKFGNVMQRDDQKCNIFNIAQRMVKINQDIQACQ